ncbi:toxin-antitoxin system YwqK family antitoxin [Hyalangium gracile]|uniref:toxin-antitoxin system YwqK family antitoxin n=1 Tax=Hyalangium gracile TaxID=394092 RepID=UPI001CD00CF7|nr:hypothetical protein [Hyalangium gracile]
MKRRALAPGKELVWPEGVPRTARYEEFGRNAASVWGQLIHDEGSAHIAWSPEGNVLSERYFDDKGRAHGLEVSRHDDGTVAWQVPWVRGRMHGLARQFDESGRELLRTRFVRGTGVDLWVSCGGITELREHRDNLLHGVERWGHPLLPYEENHFLLGKRAGVFRRWNGPRLEKGYPRYFIDDEQVSRAEYLRARRTRPALPPARRQDDRRERPMHGALRNVWLRKDIRERLLRMPEPEDGMG